MATTQATPENAVDELVIDVINTSNRRGTCRSEVMVHIKVSEVDGDEPEWIGDFWVVFTRQRFGGETAYVADWSDVKDGGNGLYVDQNPCFWMVEEAAEQLDDQYELQKFRTINSGPNDR